MTEENVMSDTQTDAVVTDTQTSAVEYSNLTEQDYYDLQQKNKQLFERAKKAEELAKQLKEEKPPAETKKQGDYLTRDEAKLYAQGYDDDDITQLRRLAGEGKIADAVNDPLFKAYKDLKETQKRIEKAQVKSKGGGQVYSEIPVSQMTEEEHRAFFEKTVNNK